MGATPLTVDGWRMKEVCWFQRTMCRMSVGRCRCELQYGVRTQGLSMMVLTVRPQESPSRRAEKKPGWV